MIRYGRGGRISGKEPGLGLVSIATIESAGGLCRLLVRNEPQQREFGDGDGDRVEFGMLGFDLFPDLPGSPKHNILCLTLI